MRTRTHGARSGREPGSPHVPRRVPSCRPGPDHRPRGASRGRTPRTGREPVRGTEAADVEASQRCTGRDSPRPRETPLKQRPSGTRRSDGSVFPLETRALQSYLHSVADTLTAVRDGCRAARPWAQQILDRAAPEPESGVIINLPTNQHPGRASHRLRGRRLRAVPPRRERRATSRRPAAARGSGFVRVTPTRTAVLAGGIQEGADPSAYPRSSELAFSEAEAAFGSVWPTLPL